MRKISPDSITRESLATLDIKRLALNRGELGPLTFGESYPTLEKLRELFVELEALGYQQNVSAPEVSQINQHIDQFISYLKQISSFDPSAESGSNKDTRDSYERSISAFYDEVTRNLRGIITYLRQEAARGSKDERKLQEEQKAVAKIRREYEEMVGALKGEREAVQKETKSVEEAKGEKAATVFGKHFEAQASEYSRRSSGWDRSRAKLFDWLLGIIVANVAAYFYLFISEKLNFWPNLPPTEFFTVQYGIAKLALIGVLSYAIGFASRNYSINSNLEAVNKHRKNVAETLKDFLRSNPSLEDRSQLVKAGAEAMFRHSNTGYASKGEVKDDGPVREIVTNILSGK